MGNESFLKKRTHYLMASCWFQCFITYNMLHVMDNELKVVKYNHIYSLNLFALVIRVLSHIMQHGTWNTNVMSPSEFCHKNISLTEGKMLLGEQKDK